MLEVISTIISATVAAASGAAVHQLAFAYKYFTPPSKLKLPPESELPSVTVCIPARNEAHALTDCLQSVLASSYPKLEIIVLDDNSVDETSVLIKSFAHAGVRFVAGQPLSKGWLGKNYALEGLLSEASGSYVLFIDVDTRVTYTTISSLVAYSLSENATMVSVLPRREDGWRASIFMSPLRYFWDVMFFQKNAPSAVGNAWMINRKALLHYGGFSAIKDVTKPEKHLASYFANNGKYRYLVSNRQLGLTYEKKWSSQVMTSLRQYYPMLGGKITPALMVIIDLIILLSPIALLAAALSGFINHLFVYITSFLIITLGLIYTAYTRRVWRSGWWLAFIIWPLIIIQEIVLIISSYVLHLRGKVTWKGRPIRSEV